MVATVPVSAESKVDYGMVLSPIPAGCEVVRGSGVGQFARFEDRYEKAILFLRSVGREPTILSYRMRATFAGEYVILQPWAGLMYNEDVYGSGPSLRCAVAR